MKRTLSWLLIVVALMTGCSRQPKDPLAWKIDAGNPADLQEWTDTYLQRMTPKLRAEVTACLNEIKSRTYDPDPIRKQHLVCGKLNDRTVREVLITGTQLAREAARARLQRESGNLLQLLNMPAERSAEEEEKFQARVAATRKQIGELEAKIAKIDARLTELMWPRAG